MKNLLGPLLRFQRQTRDLHRIMSWKEAANIARSDTPDGELSFRLASTGRRITLRRGTSDLNCLKKIFLLNEYESPFASRPRVIVDAGANIGLATLHYAAAYPEARIIAIEPEPTNFAILQKNCGDLPQVTLIQGALWDREVPLAIQDATAEKAEFYVGELSAPFSTSPETIPALTIPGILRDFGLDRIDLLKIDIEGGEYPLFQNGSEDWLGAIGQIVIELHDRYQLGCSQVFYAALARHSFVQEVRGENIFIDLQVKARVKKNSLPQSAESRRYRPSIY